MLIEPTLHKLKALRMPGFARAFKEQQEIPTYRDLSFEERVTLLVDAEMTSRENSRLRVLSSKAKLKHSGACLEDLRYEEMRQLDKSLIRALQTCAWVSAKQNILITGMTGTGKTYLACALAKAALRNGIACLYKRAPRLSEELALARADGSYRTLMQKISKVPLLIIDDWALAPTSEAERRDLLEMLEDRYSTKSTLMTSQLPVEKWHASLGDPTVADAICDRLMHNAHKIALKGDSLRKEKPVQ